MTAVKPFSARQHPSAMPEVCTPKQLDQALAAEPQHDPLASNLDTPACFQQSQKWPSSCPQGACAATESTQPLALLAPQIAVAAR
jgi:hypothetical protein